MAGGFDGASIHARLITLAESKGYGHLRLAAGRVFSTLAIFAATLTASASLAATTTVSVLLDIDNSFGTGCSVTTSDGPVLGVDKILRTIVQTNSTGYSTQSIAVENCITGSTFSAPNVFNSTPSPIARGNGVGGLSAVETYIPNSLIPAAGKVMRVAVTTDGSAGLVGTDSLLVTSTGQAILVDGPVANVIPTLSIAALALTMLLVGGAVWYARRRGWAGMQLVVVCVVALSLSGSLIAAIVRDGLVVDWTGIAPVATDPSGDAPAGMDIANLYSVAERDAVFFRADVALNAPPVADAQSVVAVAAVALPITLTGSDYEASALTYTLGASPAHGALTGTPPNLTYTATAGYGGPDSFTFKVNDGQLDSTFATVTIDVKLPPTITSANNATFIPGQANTFNFTATGVPSANFALTVCTLPPSVTLTNNGDNTATLSGNPTVAQGGTYVCTLTATNGFGAPSTQTFTLNLGLPPTFTSTAATTFTAGTAGSFTVTTTATPTTTSMTQTGALPSGVTFTYNGPGTPLNATLAGTPAPGTGGTYPLTFTAGNGIPPNSVQNFVLTVNQAPAVTSANSLTCIVGVACSLPIEANGFPLPTIAVGGAALPSGMTFAPGTPGNGLLSGTPPVGGAGTYALTFTASNGTAPDAVQNFTLTVNPTSTTTALTSGTNPSVFGQSVTFTATVTPQGAGVPGGTVTFNDGATAICSNVAVDGSAQATCTTSSLSTASHLMTAVYAGNASFTTSTSVAVSQIVNKGNTTTAVTSSANPSNFAQSVTFSATVSATAPAAGTPSGTVTFKDGATTVCGPVALVAAAATCATSTLTVGSHSITVDYAGDTNYNTSTSPALNQVINKTDTTNALAVAPVSPTVFGQSVALTSTVAAVAPGGGVPTGSVTFLDGATSIGSGALNGAGVATASTTTLAVGTHSLTANYAATTNYNGSTSSPAITFVVNKANTTASTPTSTPNPSVSGQSVSFSSTVSVTAPGAGTPTGTITFKEGATTICTGTVAAGTASCSSSTLTVGAHPVTATYDGDTNFLASSASAALTHNVNKANSAAVLVTSGTPSAFSSAVTFTVTFSASAPGVGTPTGTTSFLDNGVLIGACTNVAISAGVASCTLSGASALSTGTHPISATYGGDLSFNGVTSNIVSQAVTALATATALVSNLNPSLSGNSVTFTATVTSSATVNAGNVQFLDGATTLCTVAVNASGVATCVTSALTAASHSITAAYLGATNFNASTSAALTQIVNQAPSAITGAATVTFPIATPTSSTYAATGFPAPTFALSGCPTLPAAITLSSAGVLSGTAPVGSGGTYSCTVTASNGIGSPTTLPITININLAPSFTSAATTTFVVGTNGSFNVTANGSPAPTFSTASALPSGVSLTTGGLLSGIPGAGTGGTYPLTLTATNGVAPNATQSFSLQVNQAPTIGAIGTPTFTIGTAGSVTFTTTGVPVPTTALTGCTLPPNLTLSGNTISGTPAVGATTVTGCVITADNGVGSPAVSPAFSVVITQPPAITSGNSLTCAVGTPCSLTVAATGTPPPTLSVTGALPSGITFTPGTGVLGGTPGAATGGTYALNVTAANGIGSNATQSFTLTVNQAPSAIMGTTPVTFVVGTNSSTSYTATGFPIPTYALSGCPTLPAAITLSAAGALSGNAPSGSGGSYSCTVTASNGIGSPTTLPITVNINQPPAITSVNTLTCLAGTACPAFNVTATGFPTPTLSVSGALPSAVTFTLGTGALAGTPAALTGGSYPLTFLAVNGVGSNATQSFTLNVNEAPTAVADTPALVDANTVVTGAASGATNLLTNDARGFPVATIASYGGGSLGGSVTDHAAGSTTTFGTGGSITVNANGSYTFTPSTNFTGTFTFQYRLSNAGGVNDATVTLRFRPKVANDTLAPVVVGNVSINSASLTAPLSILTNDVYTGPVTINVGALTLQGGNITVAAGGSFTYDPPAGYEGADSFTYTLTDASGFNSTTGTVSLSVNRMIWFVNNNAPTCTVAGCGRLSNPFSTLAAFNAANGAGGNNPAVGDNLFVYESATPYTGAVTLLLRQTLIGQDANAPLPTILSFTPPTGSAALPTMNPAAAPATTINSTVTLNDQVVVRGLSINSGTSTGLTDPVAAIAGVGVSEVNVTSTTGTAVLLSNFNGIVSLTSVSANGAANGISLTNTTGSFTVTGTAAANSGGTIQNTTGPGVSLNNAVTVSLGRLTIQNIAAASGVNGTGVTNFGFTNGTISNTGNALGHSNIAFNGNGSLTGNNLSGNFTVTGSTLTNAFDHGIQVQGDNGTISVATITGNTITSTTSTATSKGSAIQLIGNGNSSTAHSLTRALIDTNTIRNFPSGAGIQVLYGNASTTGPGGRAGTNGSGTDKIVITNNDVRGQSAAVGFGTSAVLFSISGGNSGSRSQGNADISNNELHNTTGITLGIGNNGFSDATVNANGNYVDANNLLTSPGIGGGNGVVGASGTETPNLTVTATNNWTFNTSGQGIFFVSTAGGGVSVLRAKIQLNAVFSPISTDGGSRAGIQVNAGNTLGINDTVCLNVSGNTSVGSGAVTQGIGLRRQNAAGVVFGIHGMSPATATPAVEAYVSSLNPAANGSYLIASPFSGFSNCSFP